MPRTTRRCARRDVCSYGWWCRHELRAGRPPPFACAMHRASSEPMRPGGVSMVLRSELRRHAATFALAIVLAVIAGGAMLTAAAGARRSDTAYARFLDWSHAPDFGTGGGGTDEELAADLATIER